MGWISVENRLPDPFDLVLVTDGKYVDSAIWIESKWGNGWRLSHLSPLDLEEITKWALIPEPPKEKDGMD